MTPRKPKPAISVLAALLCAGAAFAQDYSNVKSPFEAPTRAEPSAPTVAPPNALDTFEFNGFTKLDGKVRVSVFDTKTRRNYWLEERGAALDGLVLKRFDPSAKTVNIGLGSVSKTLQLKSASILSLKIPPASPLPAAVGDPAAMENAAANAVATRGQESDEEVRERMRRMAEEIRRRRALRRQMIEERNAAPAAAEN